MILIKIGGLECDPVKISRISCAGMEQLLTIPGTKTRQVSAYTVNPKYCVQARKTLQFARSLGKRVIAGLTTFEPEFPPVRVFFNYGWSTKTIYKFAKYAYIKEPGGPIFHACVHLGRESFVWEPYQTVCPDPTNVYTKFKDIPMNSDGSPALRIPSSAPTYKPITPLWPYNDEELKLIKAWEAAVAYHDWEYKQQIAIYERGE